MGCLHDYQTVKETPSGIVDVCQICKKKVTYTKGKGGRLDNKKWIKENVRYTAQPGGRTGKIFNRVLEEDKRTQATEQEIEDQKIITYDEE